MILDKNAQAEASGQVQLMQVKADQGRLEHPATLGSFGHREHNLCDEEQILGCKYNGNVRMFKLVIAGNYLVKGEKGESQSPPITLIFLPYVGTSCFGLSCEKIKQE